MNIVFKHIACFAALLATSAAAAQGTSVSGVKVEKHATYADGVGEITIEAFATGRMVKTVKETHVPADIVLVLDVSGSMSDKITFNGKKEIDSGELTPGESYKVEINGKEYYLKGFKSSGTTTEHKAHNGSWTYDKVKSGTYYYKVGDQYYEVYTDYESSGMGKSKKYSYMLYYYRYSSKEIKSSSSGSEFYTGSSNFSIGDKASVSDYRIYTKTSSSKTKMEALQSSVSEFIGQIAADSRAYNVDHRISIVKFAGTSSNSIGNLKYNNSTYNNSCIVNGFLSAKDNEAGLKSTISSLNQAEAQERRTACSMQRT